MNEGVIYTAVHPVQGAVFFLHTLFLETICFQTHVACGGAFGEAMAVGGVQELIDPARSHFLAKADEQCGWYNAHVLFVVYFEVECRIVKGYRGLSVSC
jgi:hypothetical protein